MVLRASCRWHSLAVRCSETAEPDREKELRPLVLPLSERQDPGQPPVPLLGAPVYRFMCTLEGAFKPFIMFAHATRGSPALALKEVMIGLFLAKTDILHCLVWWEPVGLAFPTLYQSFIHSGEKLCLLLTRKSVPRVP